MDTNTPMPLKTFLILGERIPIILPIKDTIANANFPRMMTKMSMLKNLTIGAPVCGGFIMNDNSPMTINKVGSQYIYFHSFMHLLRLIYTIYI